MMLALQTHSMKDHHSLLGLVMQYTSQSLLFVVSVLVREQEKLMAWLTLLFIVILTTVSKVTSLHCSDQQLPASGDDDSQQVTTLQYCLFDNCTSRGLILERNWILSTLPIVSLLLPQQTATLLQWLPRKNTSFLVITVTI